VRYVLEGSIRKTEDRVRITAQLIDATTGHHLWAENYDRDLKNIFALQDEITLKIVNALQIELTDGEEARMWGRKYKNLDIYLKYMELKTLWRKGTKESLTRSGQLSQEIVDMAPESSVGHRSLALYYRQLAVRGKSPRENMKKAVELAQKALSLDESDATSHALLGLVYLKMGQWEKAIAAGERSIELEPNGALYHRLFGQTLCTAGKIDEGIAQLNQGIRLNPFPAYHYFLNLGRCYVQKGQYEKALPEFKKALQRSPNSIFNNIFIAANYALLDRQEEAEAAAKKALEINPNFSIERFTKGWRSKNPADLKQIVDAMRKAGLPE
jgi:adenylate cyclase